MSDSSGVVRFSSNYRPFGPSHGESGSETHKYTGKPQDSATGLYYFGARYYDPEIGRFTTPDTFPGLIEDPQTLNRYTYCRNNPLKYIDIDGHFGFIPFPFPSPGGSGGVGSPASIIDAWARLIGWGIESLTGILKQPPLIPFTPPWTGIINRPPDPSSTFFHAVQEEKILLEQSSSFYHSSKDQSKDPLQVAREGARRHREYFGQEPFTTDPDWIVGKRIKDPNTGKTIRDPETGEYKPRIPDARNPRTGEVIELYTGRMDPIPGYKYGQLDEYLDLLNRFNPITPGGWWGRVIIPR